MSTFTYALDKSSYTWKNALLWGNFIGHCKKATEGNLGHRVVHVLIAVIEFLPIISQIASICEKIIMDFLFFRISSSNTQPLTDRQISVKTDQENDKRIPTPTLMENANPPLENYKTDLFASLTKTIEIQREHPTYKRAKLIPLLEPDSNLPIPLASLFKRTQYFSKNATFYGYNAESIRDYGWGCAWRAIQTCLSAYNITPSFEELFHLFGSFENLKHIYENRYPGEELSNAKVFAPYDLASGWAEPFIGHMAMHFYGIPSELEIVNGIPDNCSADQQVFHNQPLTFNAFKERLEKHFETPTAAPVMIDDGTYTANIVGLEPMGSLLLIWIADPHINEGVNKLIDQEKSPAGLYRILLDDAGHKINLSLDDVDRHQVPQMFSLESGKGLHFANKRWMALFPAESLSTN